jgi:hypothetical protein
MGVVDVIDLVVRMSEGCGGFKIGKAEPEFRSTDCIVTVGSEADAVSLAGEMTN